MSQSRRLMFRPGARVEIREARHWYEAQVGGLGSRFLADLDATLARVIEQPASFRMVENADGVRRALLKRFPYSLVYHMTPSGEIVVLACAHHRRDPNAWRLPP